MSGQKRRPAPLPCVIFWVLLGMAVMLTVRFLHSHSDDRISCRTAALECALQETTPPSAQPSEANRIDLLLIGQDARQSGEASRSDAMILCSFRPGSGTVTLISFLRDLYVTIPGHADNRLNAAYAFGGTELLKQTFFENFGLTVDGCIEVDFPQFADLVDLMGGVRLELRADEAALLSQQTNHAPLTEGQQHLNGQQALAYARIRSLDADGDFSRTLRQRKLLTALLDQLRSCSFGQLLPLVSALPDIISTDLSKPQLAGYASALLPRLNQLETTHLRVPADGTYQSVTIDGMAVLIADPGKTAAFLHSALGNE